MHFFDPSKGRGRVKHRAKLPHRESRVLGSYDGEDTNGQRIMYEGLLFHHELEAGHAVMAAALAMGICLLSGSRWFVKGDASTGFTAASFFGAIFALMLTGLITVYTTRPLHRLSTS